MKSHYLIILAALTLLSCNDKISEEFDLKNDPISSKNNVFTYDMYFESDISFYDGTTRATTANDWVDGDVVYLRLMGNNHVYGKAEYISSSKKWKVTCDKSLANDTDANCCVWCGDGINPVSDEANKISFDYMTEAYLTESGKYTFSNNSIYVNATLQPVGCRLRFKGKAGDVIQVNKTTGIEVYNIMNHSSNYGFSNWSYDFELKVGSNGYTDYFVAKVSTECTSISIKNKATGEVFIHVFNSNILNIGESGCFTIPTTSDLHGWYTAENGHEYVDLGLPSGTKWATCNVGASSPEACGSYYAWGDINEKYFLASDTTTYIYYDSIENTYLYIGDDIAGTEYDVAHVKWGGRWRMPNLDQVIELIDKCNWVLFGPDGGLEGSKITGPNGRTIFMPFASSMEEWYHQSLGLHGFYWTSSLNPSDEREAYMLDSGSTGYNGFFYEIVEWSRAGALTVRAVIPGE